MGCGSASLTALVGLCMLACLVVGQTNEHPPLVTGAFTTTVYTTSLTSTQVVPQPYTLDGFGTSYCELDRERDFLFCHVSHTFARAAPLNAVIGRAAPGSAGPVVYEFTVSLEEYFEQNIILQDQEGYPVYQQVQDFLNGLWYIQVNSDTNDSAIRGQLEQSDNIYGLLASENTFPPAWGSPRRGIALGTYSWFDPQRQANFDICHDVDDATMSEIGHGVPGLPGSQVFEFHTASPPIVDDLTYTIQEEVELLAGYQYVQVFNDLNPQGAIRGQLRIVDPIPQVALTGRMDSAQLGKNDESLARGCVMVTYDCATRVMEYLVVHDAASPVSAQMRAAPPGQRGSVLFALSTAESPIYGSRQLSATEEFFLFAQQLYVQVDTVNFPNGELRGQLTTQFDYYAYLTGNQVVPPVTSASLGCATFDLTDFNYNLDFEILHTVPNPVSVNFVQGKLGQTGLFTDTRQMMPYSFLGTADSPLLGDMHVDDDEQVELVQDNTYIEVTSADYPLGEIRGQMYRINPCNPVPETDTHNVIDYAPYTYIDLPITFNDASVLAVQAALPLLVVAALAFVL